MSTGTKNFRIVMPSDLHQQIKRAAVDENTTMRALVLDLLSAYVSLSTDKRKAFRQIATQEKERRKIK